MPNRPFRVLLVSAPPFAVVEPWYDTPRFGRHGLACLAGYLRAHDDFELKLLDAKLERLSFEETARRIVSFKPDVVGFTAFTNEIKPAAHLAGLVRSLLPSATFIIGGVHVTALPEATLHEFPVFDVGCVGEGERTLLDFCRAVRDGVALGEVTGLVIRQQGGPKQTAQREPFDDLDELPLPAWDLLPRAEEYWVMTQRGCPFTCRFCMNPNGRRPRQHSIPRVVAELDDILTKYGPSKLWFADEIFTLDMDRTRTLLDAMIDIRVGARTKWWAESHVKFVDEPLFARMKAAGCEEAALGIETGAEAALKGLGKGTSIAMIEKAFGAAKRAGLKTIGFFILGHPNETEATIRETLELAVRVNPTMPIFGVMVPYPGTEVARLAALGEGGYKLLTDDWNAFNKQVGGALEFAGLSRRQIEVLQLRAYTEVFLRNGRYRDFARFAWNYRAAGLQIVRKIAGRAVVDVAPPPLTESRRQELAGAAGEWAARQAQTARRLKTLSVPRAAGTRTGSPPPAR
jgi:radical SAM superfamily enzyme YgiQ (UPF0313 family)